MSRDKLEHIISSTTRRLLILDVTYYNQVQQPHRTHFWTIAFLCRQMVWSSAIQVMTCSLGSKPLTDPKHISYIRKCRFCTGHSEWVIVIFRTFNIKRVFVFLINNRASHEIWWNIEVGRFRIIASLWNLTDAWHLGNLNEILCT